MKRIILTAACVGLMASQAFAATHDSANLNTQQGRLSYTLGVDIGNNFKNIGVQLDPNAVAMGIRDGLSGGKLKLSKDVMKKTMIDFQKEIMAKRAKQFKAAGDKNAQEGATFLQQNKRKPGIVALSNGLQYKVIQSGHGAKPTIHDVVTVEYEGKTIGGKVFDSSYKRGKPVKFMVKDVIPAWKQALQLMKAGSTWLVFAPPSLAYGKHGYGPIGPNSTLVFKIHLISVQKGQAKQKQSHRRKHAQRNRIVRR